RRHRSAPHRPASRLQQGAGALPGADGASSCASEANAALLGSLAALAGRGGRGPKMRPTFFGRARGRKFPEKANTSKPASSPPLNAPAQALSGDETKRRMALVNADREIVRKIMTEPGPRWEPQAPPRAENAANFFRWAANAPFEQGAVGDLR